MKEEYGINSSDFFTKNEGKVYRKMLEAIEKPLIETALEKACGNQIKAAKILGLNRNTLRTKMKKFRINPDRWRI
jgi:two-component system, NtrC family, nitrogen regulation response regulator GlnG